MVKKSIKIDTDSVTLLRQILATSQPEQLARLTNFDPVDFLLFLNKNHLEIDDDTKRFLAELRGTEAYTAERLLQELHDAKSEDMARRSKIYEAIIKKGEVDLTPGIPESFNVLIEELNSIGAEVAGEQAGEAAAEAPGEDEEAASAEIEAEERFLRH